MGEKSPEDPPEPAQPDPPSAPDPEPPAPAAQPGDDPTPRLPSTVMPASRPRFVRGFCLGALSIVVIAVLAIGGFFLYMYDRVLDDEPMPVRVLRYTNRDWKKIKTKFDDYGEAIYRGRDREVSFSEREFNIFTNQQIRELGYEMGQNNFYVRIVDKNVVFYMSMYWADWEKWVNVKAKGSVYVRDGRLALELTYAKVGRQEMPDSSLPDIATRIIDHVNNTPAYQEGIGLVRSARVQNGKLHVRLHMKKFKEFYNRMKDQGEL